MNETHNPSRPFTGVAVFFLGLVALAHLLRAFTGWTLVIEGWLVPVWLSVAVAVPLLALAAMVWREAHR